MEGKGQEDNALSKLFFIVLTLEEVILYISKNKIKSTKTGKNETSK